MASTLHRLRFQLKL